MAADGVRSSLAGTFSRTIRVNDLAALVLLFVLLAAAAAGISSVLTGPNWGLLLQSLLIGLLLGWGMALFRQSAWRAALVVITLGITYIFLFPGGLIWKTMAVLVEILRLVPNGFDFLRGEAVDLASLTQAVQMFVTSTGIITARLQAWIAAFVEGQPTFDPVAAALIWNACVWLVAAWAGWILEARQNTLLATIPAILLSVSTLAYGQRTPVLLYLILGSLLLLLAVVQHGQREHSWVESGVAYPVKKGRQIIHISMLFTLALVSFSALTTSISVHRIREWISEHTKSTAQQDDGEFGKSLGIIPGNTAVPDIFETVRSPGLPQGHLIGSGPELSEHIVMTVAVNVLPTQYQGGLPSPLYWRSLTYDTYTGKGWRSSGTSPDSYDADQLIQANRAPNHILIQQKVYPVENLGGKVYTAGELVSLIFIATDHEDLLRNRYRALRVEATCSAGGVFGAARLSATRATALLLSHVGGHDERGAKEKPTVGVEPTTPALRKPCSAIELHRHAAARSHRRQAYVGPRRESSTPRPAFPASRNAATGATA